MIKPHLIFLFIRPVKAMLKFLELAAVSWGLVIGMYIPVSGQVEIDLSVSPDSLTVGDKFQFVNRVRVPEGSEIAPLPPADHLGEAVVLSDISALDKTDDSGIAFACSLSFYKTGQFALPSFTFSFTDSSGDVREIRGDSIMVTVNSILPADSAAVDSADIADIREPYRIPAPVWPFVVLPLAILILGYAAFKLYHRFRKIPVLPVQPSSPPWEIAFRKLDDLKRSRHYEFGRVKQFYSELSLITRQYIEDRYEFPAAESTTYELAAEEKLRQAGDLLCGRLFDLFERADMAKFARGIPSRLDSESDLEFAYEFVRRTIPSAPEPSKLLEVPAEVKS